MSSFRPRRQGAVGSATRPLDRIFLLCRSVSGSLRPEVRGSVLAVIHLEGNNRPVRTEHDGVPVRVVGELPRDLRGTFLRNGPNPRTGWSPHLFAGDGMIHSIGLPRGRYRNRWVRTPLFDDAGARRDGLRVTTANTHVVAHAGRLLALEEGGLPYEMTRGLDTIGPFDFAGALSGPMTAHPKVCPETGELLFFGYSIRPPFLTYYRVDANGVLVQATPIDLAVPSMMHDFAITRTRVLFFDSPFVFDWSLAAAGFPWRWDADHGASVGVMDRVGGAVRWMDVSTGHLSHVANAWDDGDAIVMTGTRTADPTAMPLLHEWRIDPVAGTVDEQPLWDVPTTTHRLPTGHTCGEPVHVARSERDEDDGYLLTFARRSSGRLELSPGARLVHAREPRRGPPAVPGARRLPRIVAAGGLTSARLASVRILTATRG